MADAPRMLQLDVQEASELDDILDGWIFTHAFGPTEESKRLYGAAEALAYRVKHWLVGHDDCRKESA